MQNVSYAADKPNDCSNCYFWKGKKGCALGKENCYYLIRVPQNAMVVPTGEIIPVLGGVRKRLCRS